MRGILAFILSIAVGLLMTAAGLKLDASVLTYAGVILLALVAVLWLWWWGTSGLKRPDHPAPATAPNPGVIERDPRVIRQNQIHNMRILAQRVQAALTDRRNLKPAAALWPEMRAALLTLRGFGIPIPEEKGAAIDDLYRGMHLMNEVLPLLRQGHDAEAADHAQKFLAGE